MDALKAVGDARLLLICMALYSLACCGQQDQSAAEPTEEATEEATPEPTPTEVALTDSYKGVTAAVIKIGVPVVDNDAVGTNPSHDAMTIWQAAADKINADGGVGGRQIELHMSLADPTDTNIIAAVFDSIGCAPSDAL